MARGAIALVLVLAAGVCGQDDPQVSQLVKLRKQLRDGDTRAQWRAMRQLVAVGKPAVKLLTDLALEVDAKQEPRASARIAAVGLGRLGATAVDAVPQFKELYETGGMAQGLLALEVLGALGPHSESGQDLMQAVFQGRSRNRGLLAKAERRSRARSRMSTDVVVSCLLRLQWAADDSVEDLVTHIEGESAAHIEIGLERLLAIARTGKHAAKIEKIATRALLRKSVRKTRFNLRGGGWGWGGSTYTRTEDRVPRLAAEILQVVKATPEPEVRVKMHAAMLSHPDPAVRQRHVLALGGVRAKVDRVTVASLASRVADKDKLVAWDAITALGMLGAAASQQIPRLKQLAAGSDKAKAVRAKAAAQMIERDMARKAAERARKKSQPKEPGPRAEVGRV